tara:strand:+ start:1759 stop:1959 length:201 start_codon:yes stop_codon:yes gene_type:complete
VTSRDQVYAAVKHTEKVLEECICWLINNKPATIIFEACSTSNYWKQKGIEAGHDARLISAKLVARV